MKRIVLSIAMGTLLMGTTTVTFAQTQPKGKVNQRKKNQQERIGNGVKSGALTAGETSKLEHQESGLNKEIHSDRKANGGNLTNNEKKQVNQQQNQLSKEIYDDKHNAARQ
jgi:hypothetical protein